jgi:hypothetical protein
MIPVEKKGIVGSVQAIAPNSKLILWGYHVSETAGATADVTLYHGLSTSDQALTGKLYMAANGAIPMVNFYNPIPCPNGIFISRGSGTTTVVLYVDYQ